MVTSEDLQRIVSFLEGRFGLDTLWLFGSEAQGRARPDSDVDLAALFPRRPTALEVFDARSDLAEILHRDVDLVDLDQVSPILGMQVLRHGRLLVDRDPRRRHAFFGRTISMYEDLKIIRREAERMLFERVSGARP
jgi:predicted nucleotidyltransferase